MDPADGEWSPRAAASCPYLGLHWRRAWSGVMPSVAMSALMFSTKSSFSFAGLVSSNRTMSLPLYMRAK